MSARKGFTLLEITFAAAIMTVVLAGSMSAFFSMRRAQGTAVVASQLKISGQRAMRSMYMELSQCRKLLASSSLDAPIKDMGREYFTLFQRPATPEAIAALDMRFPRIDANGGFGVPGPNSGEFEEATVGNTLVFVVPDKTIRLKTTLLSVSYGFPPTTKLLSDQPYLINTHKFVAYFLAKVPLEEGQAPIKISATQTRDHTLQLMRWESKPYVELGEFKTLAGKLVGGNLAALGAWTDLQNTYGVTGLWNVAAPTAATSIYKMVNGTTGPEQETMPAIAQKSLKAISKAALSGMAQDMVAFNTNLGADYRFLDFAVPTYAPKDGINAVYPWGFEVAITGPSGARSLLIRLALAARLNTSKHLYGQVQQEVVKVFDM
jgi:type II secretory pathway pseudopilin PulG